jgi:hypothetical protein
MNSYRVDRAMSTTVPCGMNSILYIGDSWDTARDVFHKASPGYDAWNKPNGAYGVILSAWDTARRDYIARAWKGL